MYTSSPLRTSILVGREEAVSLVSDMFTSQLAMFSGPGTTDWRGYQIPAFLGSPGIGKSRMLAECAGILKTIFPNNTDMAFITLPVSFRNGVNLLGDYYPTVHKHVGWMLLSTLLPGPCHALVNDPRAIPLDVALMAVIKLLLPNRADKKVAIYIAIDEVGALSMGNPRNVDNLNLLLTSIKMSAEALAADGIFVFAAIAGIISPFSISASAAAKLEFARSITLPLLDLTECSQLAEDWFNLEPQKQRFNRWRANAKLRWLLGLASGVPRVLANFLFHISRDTDIGIKQSSYDILLSSTGMGSKMDSLVAWPFSGRELAYVLFKIPPGGIVANDSIPGSDITHENLMDRSAAHFHETNNKYLLKVPFVFLLQPSVRSDEFLTAVSNFVKRWLLYLDTQGTISTWQLWEALCAEMVCLRYLAYSCYPEQRTALNIYQGPTVADIFGPASDSHPFASNAVCLPKKHKLIVQRLNLDWPNNSVVTPTSSWLKRVIDYYSFHNIALAKENQPGADIFWPVSLDIGTSSPEEALFAIQCKWYNSSRQLQDNEISSLSNALKKCASSGHLIPVIFHGTTRASSSTISDAIVISQDRFGSFFGPSLSSVAFFLQSRTR